MSYKPVNILIQCRAWDWGFFRNMLSVNLGILNEEQKSRVSQSFMERFRELWLGHFISIEYPEWNKQMADKYKPKPLTKLERIMAILKEKE